MKTKAAKKKAPAGLSLVRSNAAGIDIGDTFHAVAVPEGRDEQRVRTFGSMTCDLLSIAEWLHTCGIDTVAMESTGVYWKPLFGVLIKEGFDVYLVNSQQVRNVSGRKTDEYDAMWIQKLHSCGLLKSSYLPDDEGEASHPGALPQNTDLGVQPLHSSHAEGHGTNEPETAHSH